MFGWRSRNTRHLHCHCVVLRNRRVLCSAVRSNGNILRIPLAFILGPESEAISERARGMILKFKAGRALFSGIKRASTDIEIKRSIRNRY